MTQGDQGPVPVPEFPPDVTWLRGGRVRMSDLRGRPVLLDFWDYTSVGCIRALPYVTEWYRRYKDHGLVVIGVHAPEFSFAHNADHVRRAVADHGIEYAVALDNDHAIWQLYANRYRPSKYLIDANGYLRFYHLGEGGYQETEQAVQTLIKETTPDALLPGLMAAVRDTDAAGAICYRVTPDLYLGYLRGRIGNTADFAPDKPATYRDLSKHAEGFFYLEGDWMLTGESAARPIGASGESRLHVRYLAKEVNLVAMPPYGGGNATIQVLQDGETLAREDTGDDVRIDGEKTVLAIDRPRMYRIIDNRQIDTHDLTLVTSTDGVAMYALTFVTCVANEL